VDFTFTGADADADLTLLLLGPGQKVRHDEDFIFYNQPVAAGGAVRLLGKTRHGRSTSERAALRLTALPHDVQRVVISINMDVDHGRTCAALQHALLHIVCRSAAWAIPTPPDAEIRAMILAEIYRHTSNGQSAWKLRAVCHGWAGGLSALARDYGVDIE
jgi:stress response protein SCP2